MAASWHTCTYGSYYYLVARRGSNKVEKTAQVAGPSYEHGKDQDEEAGTQNQV